MAASGNQGCCSAKAPLGNGGGGIGSFLVNSSAGKRFFGSITLDGNSGSGNGVYAFSVGGAGENVALASSGIRTASTRIALIKTGSGILTLSVSNNHTAGTRDSTAAYLRSPATTSWAGPTPAACSPARRSGQRLRIYKRTLGVAVRRRRKRHFGHGHPRPFVELYDHQRRVGLHDSARRHDLRRQHAAAATAVAIVNAQGQVTGIALTYAGSGYQSPPTITIAAPGSGTAATATDTLGVAAVAISGGTGYTSAPTISFSGGGGQGASVAAYVAGNLSFNGGDLQTTAGITTSRHRVPRRGRRHN